MSGFNDLEVRRVGFTATVTFEAYVAVGDNGRVDTTRVASEIADAIEYRAVHLHDAEDGDALIALVGGGSGFAVTAEANISEVFEEVPSAAEVESAVEGTMAWL